MERSKKLALEDLIKMGYKTVYAPPPTPRRVRMAGNKRGWVSHTNDPFESFDVLAVDDYRWHCVQATEGGHAAERRDKIDKNYLAQPPSTLIDVWEYVFKGRKRRTNIYRRVAVGKWLRFKNGKWIPVVVIKQHAHPVHAVLDEKLSVLEPERVPPVAGEIAVG